MLIQCLSLKTRERQEEGIYYLLLALDIENLFCYTYSHEQY
ncbi:hypothetical protein [Rhabdochlamydiaceae symbiont of Dictyostelium giganteum]